MRSLWPDIRHVLAMQSRRRDKRSLTLAFGEMSFPAAITHAHRPRRLVRGHLLRGFKLPSVFEIGGDAGCPELTGCFSGPFRNRYIGRGSAEPCHL
jgi:hypothetical protein